MISAANYQLETSNGDSAVCVVQSILMQYFVRELANSPRKGEYLNMLSQAYELRSLVLVIDGIDEAAGRRETISRFIREFLVPMGMRIVCTARPEAVEFDNFGADFVVMALRKLSDEQQRAAAALRLVRCGGTPRHLL